MTRLGEYISSFIWFKSMMTGYLLLLTAEWRQSNTTKISDTQNSVFYRSSVLRHVLMYLLIQEESYGEEVRLNYMTEKGIGIGLLIIIYKLIWWISRLPLLRVTHKPCWCPAVWNVNDILRSFLWSKIVEFCIPIFQVVGLMFIIMAMKSCR